MKTLSEKRTSHQERHDMSEAEDATRLADLLSQQRAATLAISQTRDPTKRASLAAQVKEKREECLVLVERYFRQTLRPVLAKRFPRKGLQSAPAKQQVYSNDAMFRYTELVNDFFVQVLSKVDDPFWKKDSAIELRNYASIVISNHGIRDALRRRKKREPLGEQQLRDSLADQLATEVEQRFVAAGIMIDPADVLDIVDQWQQSDDEHLQKLAMLMRHKYVADMTMQQIADDLKAPYPTVCRWHIAALQKLRETLSSS
jgi:hypothetical protein